MNSDDTGRTDPGQADPEVPSDPADPGPDAQATAKQTLPRGIWALVGAAFVIALGYGIVAPALPQFARSFDVSITAASVVVSAFAAMRLVFAPGAGQLVQRFGERRIYLTGLLIVAVSTGACAFAETYWQLLVFRAFGGIGSTMFTVSALGLLIRMSPPSARGKVSGRYASAFLLGNMCGPLLGGAVVGFGLKAPFVVYAIALVVAATVVAVSLRGTELGDTSDGAPVRVMTLREAWSHRVYRASLWSNFAVGWSNFGLRVAVVPLFVVDALERDETFAGIALAVFAIGNAVVLPLSGRLSDRYGRRPFVLVGMSITAVATAVFGTTDSVPVFLVATAVAGLGAGLATPSQQAAVADVVGATARGGPVLAAFQMTSDVGAVVGPIVGGMLAERWSYGVAFTTTAVILATGAVAWLFVRADPPTPTVAGPTGLGKRDVAGPDTRGGHSRVEPDSPDR